MSDVSPEPLPRSLPSQVFSLGLMVSVRLLAALAIMKYISWVFGPEQFGILVHIIGTAAIFYSISGTSLVNGVTRVVAADESEEERSEWLGAAIKICLAASALLAIGLLLAFAFGADALLGDAELAPILIVIAVAQFAVGIGNVVLAFLVGAGKLRAFVSVNMAGSILSAFSVVAVASLYGYGATLYVVGALPLAPSVLAIAILWLAPRRHGAFRMRSDPAKIKLLLRHSGATLVAIASTPVAQFLLRTDLAERSGWEAVGYWQSIARISDAYMQVFGVIFINYLLPTLTRLETTKGSIQVFARSAAGIVLLFMLGAAVFATWPDQFIRLAYSSAFLPADVYVVPQLAGDFAKIIGLMIAYYFIARGQIWTLGMAELLYAIVLLGSYAVLVPRYGASAPLLAHVISSWILMAAMIALFTYFSSRHRKIA